MRVAIVTGGADSIEQVEAYMPENYTVSAHYVRAINAAKHGDVLIITGEDKGGWTLDEYVIPRLASGLIFATEIPTE